VLGQSLLCCCIKMMDLVFICLSELQGVWPAHINAKLEKKINLNAKNIMWIFVKPLPSINT